MHLAFVQALPCKYTHSRSVAQRCWPQHVGRAYSYSPLPPLFFSSSSPCPFVLSFSTLPSSVRPASSTNSLHHLFPRSRPQSRPHSVRAQIRVNPLVVAEGGVQVCSEGGFVQTYKRRRPTRPRHTSMFVTVYKSVEFTGSTYLWTLAPSCNRSENRH